MVRGLAHNTTPVPDATQSYPMFVNNESSISISFAEVKYNSSVPDYTIYFQEIREDITHNLLEATCPDSGELGKTSHSI